VERLSLASLAEAAFSLNRHDYWLTAEKNASFLLQSLTAEHICSMFTMWSSQDEGYLRLCNIIEGLLKYISYFTGKWLDEAARLSELMIELFWTKLKATFMIRATGIQLVPSTQEYS